jgi:hypothetical protein
MWLEIAVRWGRILFELKQNFYPNPVKKYILFQLLDGTKPNYFNLLCWGEKSRDNVKSAHTLDIGALKTSVLSFKELKTV